MRAPAAAVVPQPVHQVRDRIVPVGGASGRRSATISSPQIRARPRSAADIAALMARWTDRPSLTARCDRLIALVRQVAGLPD